MGLCKLRGYSASGGSPAFAADESNCHHCQAWCVLSQNCTEWILLFLTLSRQCPSWETFSIAADSELGRKVQEGLNIACSKVHHFYESRARVGGRIRVQTGCACAGRFSDGHKSSTKSSSQTNPSQLQRKQNWWRLMNQKASRQLL